MAHTLIVGTTLSGKSTLAKSLVEEAARFGAGIVVYDPTLSEWPGALVVTADPDEFFLALEAEYKLGKPIVAVVDEAETLLSQGDRENWWLFTRGRHYGISSIAITQRPKLVAPTVRGNVATLAVFKLNRTDAAELAADFCAPEVEGAAQLKRGEFYFSRWSGDDKITELKKIF